MSKLKYFIVVVCMVSNILTASSQEICGMGTENSACTVLNYEVDTTCSDLSARRFISLKFHNICKDSGTDCLDPRLLLLGIQTINKYFNTAGIYFEMDMSSSFLNSTSLFFDNNSSQLMGEYLSNTDPQHLNLFCQPITSNPGTGAAINVPSNALAIRGNFGLKSVYESTVIAHEVGHCLGLQHIFGCLGGGDSPFFENELCDGSNCGQSGDMICDTAPDDSGTFNVDSISCKYTSGLACPGDSLGSINNIMGYHHEVCKTDFTRQQYLAMKCALDKREELEDMQRERSIQYITGNDTFASNLLIYDDIIIQSGGELTITDTLSMPSYGSIIVKNGGKLNVAGGTITSFITGSFWQGIIVEGTGQTSGNGWLVLDGATLEHARLAVYSENGGRVNAENSTFRNNKKSILISQYRRPVPNKISNCTFITDEELFDVAWHVPLWDSTVLELNGSQNNHPDHDYFVQVESSNLVTVIGSDFISTASLDENRYGAGINLIDADMAISGCHFENQRFGISKHNTFPGGKGVTSIKNNTFEDCRWSILLGGGDFTRIVGNTFQIPHDTDTLQIAAGIINLGSNAVQIKDGNSFGASDANNSFFIYSSKFVDQHASEITRNTFGRADSSSWRQVELQGAQDSLQIFCNNFNLSAGADFAVGLDTGTTLMDQGTDVRPAGNDWNTIGNCMMSINETHIYSNSSNDSLGYIAFMDKEPDCVSLNVNTDNNSTPQPPDFCDVVLPCPPPSIPCGIEILDSTLLVIDTLLYRPPYGMSLTEIDRNLGFARHAKNIIVQDILIDLIEQDSIEQAVEWLDSVAVRTDDYDSLHLYFLERYDNLPQRPTFLGSDLYAVSLRLKQAIASHSSIHAKIQPLIKIFEPYEPISYMSAEDNFKSYQIWPNPVDNQLNILWRIDKMPIKWNLILRDIHGKVKINSSLNTEEKTSFDVSNLNAGIYFISIFSENMLIGIEKIIIAR